MERCNSTVIVRVMQFRLSRAAPGQNCGHRLALGWVVGVREGHEGAREAVVSSGGLELKVR